MKSKGINSIYLFLYVLEIMQKSLNIPHPTLLFFSFSNQQL
jgi:hypothetical protein